MLKSIVIYMQGKPEHAEALASELRAEHPGARLSLFSYDDVSAAPPPWADEVLDRPGLRRLRRPDILVIAISNEARYLRPGALLRASWYAISLMPKKRLTYLYAWSGRYTFREKAGEVLRKAAGLAFRPLYLAVLRILRGVLEVAFPMINRKPRGLPLVRQDIKKVLVLSLDLVGDLVWAGPAVSFLKKSYPGAAVDICVYPGNAAMARIVEGVDDVVVYDAPWLRKVTASGSKKRTGRLRNLFFRMSLIARGYDLVVDLRGEARNIVFAYLTGAPYRTGFAGKSIGAVQPDDVGYLLTSCVKSGDMDGRHMLLRNLSVAGQPSGETGATGKWLDTGRYRDRIMEMLSGEGIKEGDLVIGVQPGASRPEKRWDKDRFVDAAKLIVRDTGARIVVAGSRDEGELAGYVAVGCTGAVDLSGRTSLQEYAALVEACDLFITNETSAISIASAVKTPVVCLMTGVPELYGPYGVPNRVLQKKPGCWAPVFEHCFCAYGYRCLQEITPEEVRDAAVSLLRETGRIS